MHQIYDQGFPNEWSARELKELAEINYGKSPKGIVAEDGQIPVVGTGGIERHGNSFLYEGESIVLGRKGTIDKPIYLDGKFWPIDTTFYLSNFNDACVIWLFYFLKTIDLRSMNEATGVPSLSRTLLYSIKVSTPPKEEQEQIAVILSQVDRAIEQTESMIAKLQLIKTGLMHDLLTRGIDEHGNIRSEATHEFKDSPVGRIPKEWEVEAIGNIFEMTLGKMLNKSAKLGPNQFPYLANRNVQWEDVDLSDLDTMNFSEVEQKRLSLRAGDLLVCEGGAVGRAAIWKGEMESCFFQKAIHRLRPKDDSILPEYMLAFLQLADRLGLFTDLTSQTSIAHLTQEKLALLKISLSPIEEQERIMKIVEIMRRRISVERNVLSKLQRTKTGLMQDLLTGKIRVNQLFEPLGEGQSG